MKENPAAHRLTVALLVIYLITLFWIIVLKMGIDWSYMSGPRSYNLIPYNQPLMVNGKPDVTEIILNMLIFVPLGVYLGTLLKSVSIIKKVSMAFGVSLFLELSQFTLALGAFDITDLINNTLGGLIGVLLYSVMKKLTGSDQMAQKVVNSLFLTGTLLVLGTILYLKINHLLMFRN